ncbi:hypothetical protein T11_12453 [Trichinella zimbabwensis]|uniref:Uncharacterized protein n=1 Tax=Trichinella zimbabwensis TaxID=268475 RepID=A0A0V1GQX8_9BILA|nr:hypothetical protein T11_12453 [Trichinella zimbabwensis]
MLLRKGVSELLRSIPLFYLYKEWSKEKVKTPPTRSKSRTA